MGFSKFVPWPTASMARGLGLVSLVALSGEVLRQLTIEIGASSYRTQCVDGRNLSLACSPDAGDKGKRAPGAFLFLSSGGLGGRGVFV